MDNKIIDLNRSVFELCNEYNELIPILSEIGFTDITKKGMLTTVGRFMTIPKGAAMKKISMSNIKDILISKGFQIID